MWQSRVEIECYSVEVKIEFNADTVTSGLRLHGSRSIARPLGEVWTAPLNTTHSGVASNTIIAPSAKNG